MLGTGSTFLKREREKQGEKMKLKKVFFQRSINSNLFHISLLNAVVLLINNTYNRENTIFYISEVTNLEVTCEPNLHV